MVVSVVRMHLCDCHACHFANTHHNLCPSLGPMEWFECAMHIWCLHLVVTPLVCIHQEWQVLQHQVLLSTPSAKLRRWFRLCLQPVVATVDDVARSCEESLESLESLRDGTVRICPSEPFESHDDLVGMVCA